MRPPLLSLVVLVPALTAACAERPALDGTWQGGGGESSRYGSWVLSLSQEDEEIRGVACHLEGDQRDGDLAVDGRYPFVFVPFASDADLILEASDEATLSASVRGESLGVFRRVDPSVYAACMSAPAAPR